MSVESIFPFPVFKRVPGVNYPFLTPDLICITETSQLQYCRHLRKTGISNFLENTRTCCHCHFKESLRQPVQTSQDKRKQSIAFCKPTGKEGALMSKHKQSVAQQLDNLFALLQETCKYLKQNLFCNYQINRMNN